MGQVQGDQLAARECYLTMLAMDEQVQAMNIEEKRVVAELTEALEDISLNENNPERCTRVGANLEEKIKNISQVSNRTRSGTSARRPTSSKRMLPSHVGHG